MRTKPQQHQKECFLKTADSEYWGLFLEQGLGKTKIGIDTAYHLWSTKKIDGMLVLAPNGVHLNWIYSEMPKHAWSDDYIAAAWRNPLRKKDLQAIEAVCKPDKWPRFFFANIEAIRTKKGYSQMVEFLKSGRMLLVVDESTVIKNPKAAQTKAAVALAQLAPYRRIMTGTPMTQGPLDLYSQCYFLHPSALPMKSYFAFKHTFAVERPMLAGNRVFNKVVGYRNLDYLKEVLKPFTTRLTKEDCLDLPEKIFQRHYVEFTRAQETTYRSIKETQVAMLEQEQRQVGMVSVTSVLAALVKLHQVCCGFVIDDDGKVHELENNRFEALDYLTEEEDQKYVIWTVYRHSVEQIRRHIEATWGRGSVVSYYGGSSPEERVDAVRRFNEDDTVRFFVANRAASKGLTLTRSARAIYFASSYSLEDRLQSADRIHRIGQTRTCVYTDILTHDTVEEKILNIIDKKQELSNEVITSDWRRLIQ